MKISDINTPSQVTNRDISLSAPKHLNELVEGNRFKATVLDIQPNHVSLELDSGEIVKARSLILPDARIGEEALFSVKNNANGQLMLEMVKPEGHMPTSFIKEALSNAGMYPTRENIELVNTLLENQLPVDAEMLQKAAFFKYSENNMSMEKILFLLKENFEASPLTIKTLNSIMDKTITLDENLKNIIFQLTDKSSTLPEHVKRDILSHIIHDPSNPENARKILEKKLFINLEGEESLDKLSKFYKELNDFVEKAKKSLEKHGLESDTHLSRELNNVKDNILFMEQIKNYKEYFQMPFIINENKMQGELYVFKDGKKRNKNLNEQASILISMDYAFLGHMEIFINKNRNDLNFQFRANNDKSLKLIGASSQKLSNALADKGYSVSGLALKKLDEPFNVTKDISTPEKNGKPTKRFSFDMRV